MKREGRQHGMIRTHMILPNNKHYTQFQSPHHSNEGILGRVAAKPTNHSKSTWKVGKSRGKDKGKGGQKVKAFDVGMNHRLVSWRVVDDKGYHGMNYVGVSASDVLGHLSNYYHDYEDEDHEGVDVDEHDCYHDSDDSFGVSDELKIGSCSVAVAVVEEREEIVDGGKEIDIDEAVNDDDDDDMGMYDFVDDDMGFCDVGFVIQQIDGDSDEGWCLVGELGED
ncbi:hypothetical protein ACHQM5_010804 [Ranunculus cassubicifolius]